MEKILNGKIELKNDKGVSALDIISPHLLKLNNSWDKIYGMFADINRSGLRLKLKDSSNSGWKFIEVFAFTLF